jgi:hypothetical protein
MPMERWQRRAVYWTIALLTLSGLAWLVAHFFLRPVTEFGEAVSPFEPWSMKLHGAVAMVLLFLIGSMLNNHIRRGLRARRNLNSGWSMIVMTVLLVLTGYGLYYLAGEATRPLWSWTHWVIGIGFAAGLPLHVWLGRKAPR